MEEKGKKAIFRINDELTAEELLMLNAFRKLTQEDRIGLLDKAKELYVTDIYNQSINKQ